MGAMTMVSGVDVGVRTAVSHPTNNKTTTNQMTFLFISPTSFASNLGSGQLCLTQDIVDGIIASGIKICSHKDTKSYRKTFSVPGIFT